MTQTALLGDICIQITDGTHSTVKDSEDGDYYLLSAKNIKNRIVITSNERRIDERTLTNLRKRTNTAKGDVLLTSVGTIGETAIIKEENPGYEFQRSVLIFKPDTTKVIPEYLYYVLRSKKSHFISMATGAVQKCLFIGPVKNELIQLPDLEMQKKIAAILGTLDEKIELNRKMNETLEQMGQALFRHNFINNPEAEKWEVGTVSDLVAIYSGYAFKRTDFTPDGKYGLVTIKNVQDGNFLTECSDHLAAVPAKVQKHIHLKTGDVLLSLTGNVGRVCITYGENLLLNQRVAKLSGAHGRHSYAYFMFRQNEFKEKLISMSRGTAQLNLSPIETKKVKIKLPPASLLQKFYNEAEPLFETITENYQQIQTLITLRDTLLPRLISGKVKV